MPSLTRIFLASGQLEFKLMDVVLHTDQQSHAAARTRSGCDCSTPHALCQSDLYRLTTSSMRRMRNGCWLKGIKAPHRFSALHCIASRIKTERAPQSQAHCMYTASAILEMHQTCVLVTTSLILRGRRWSEPGNRRRCRLFQSWMQHDSSRLMPLHLDQDRAQFQTRESR
ncbi:hypothetical protein M440DRAFT_225197 [Trichoderma longibrachiatum ATCC 18648]|uniref:Uncharacterized protein n=1 Tax=Trichoderma longibrachiatum ATCC 18648 TaxID=983965 RepID=A0A2T4CBN5_TRILO|nr:hypothetical protein M440DRAFT_225197 [Trichoderma longibrachiatum ATCC 18648]